MRTNISQTDAAFEASHSAYLDALSYANCPDLDAIEADAHAWLEARFGRRTDLGRRQTLDYLRGPWGISKDDLAGVDVAIAAGSIAFSRTATFRVGYQMAPGRSSGGNDRGSSPVSASMYTLASVDAWAASIRRYG